MTDNYEDGKIRNRGHSISSLAPIEQYSEVFDPGIGTAIISILTFLLFEPSGNAYAARHVRPGSASMYDKIHHYFSARSL